MYRRILAPLDGSPFAEVALTQIHQLGGPETEVLFLRVLEPVPADVPAMAFVPSPTGGGTTIAVSSVTLRTEPIGVVSELADRRRHEAQKYLEEKAEALRSIDGTQRILVLEDQDPASAIAGVARDEAADLIVMSTHARSGAARWFLGSVAEKVLHSTSIPVLLVRPGKPPD
ncbi:MAG TPA: universal stress protein [Chloroflexota bacterium]|nr:universal stress protein [Chloroflexota bacterium]